jgi:hypothetical protein
MTDYQSDTFTGYLSITAGVTDRSPMVMGLRSFAKDRNGLKIGGNTE